jgi:LysR family nitrogen assimilation transcriptional regulator
MSDKRMDLPQLRIVIQVAEVGSLNKASDRMRIAQPALSRQIRLLEEELQTKLFVRHGRGMMLTPAGHKVLDRAHRIMREVEHIRVDIDIERADVGGKVAVGLPPTVGEAVTVPFASMMQERFPLLRIQFSPGFGGHLVEWLQRGDIDMAVLYDARPLKSVHVRPLLSEALFAVGGAEAGLTLDRPISFAELVRLPLVLPTERHSLRWLAENAARQAKLMLNVRHEVESLATIRDLVRSEAGVTLLPLWSVRRDLAAGYMTAAPVVEPTLSRNLVIASSTDRPLSRAALVCEEALLELVDRLKTDGTMTNILPMHLAGSSGPLEPSAKATLSPPNSALISRPVQARRQATGLLP